MENANLAEQIEEVEALSAIYDNDWIVDSEADRKYIINIDKDIRLLVRLSDDYPSNGPPYFELDAVGLMGQDRDVITDRLNTLYADHLGEPVIYIWVEAIREYLSVITPPQPDHAVSSSEGTENASASGQTAETDEVSGPHALHDDPITDRKSTFQAHVAKVTELLEVSAVMSKLLSNKKIAGATHNIQAYRIQLSNGSIAEDCDDDGETHAGSRLLHLLNILGAVDVLVVVSRWYGGIQLGPDRFKHINNCARNALQKHNFIPTASPSTPHGKTSSRKGKKS